MEDRSMKILKILFVAMLIVVCNSCGHNDYIGNDIRLWEDTDIWAFAKSLSKHNFEEADDLLLRNIININLQESKYGETLLHWAVLNDDYEAVVFLVDHGANPNVHNTFNGESPMIAAAFSNADDKILSYLLLKKGNPNDYVHEDEILSNGRSIETPLTSAAFTSIEKTKMLIKAGADVNFSVIPGHTPLYVSALKTTTDVLEYLFFDCNANYRKTFIVTINGDTTNFVSLLKNKYITAEPDKIVVDSIIHYIENKHRRDPL